MTSFSVFSDPQEVIGRLWSEDPPPEQKRILALARDAIFFVWFTGQRYHFEDFRKAFESGAPSPARVIGTVEPAQDGLANLKERMDRTAGFFTKLRDEAGSTEEKALIQVILDTLHFISSTGQHGTFGEYLEAVETNAPPHVVASFDTRGDAESWLRNHPSPPRVCPRVDRESLSQCVL
ncbi:hypothetical protein [Vitiosangium sp. GDMCC 1.1324]|uniref:hypothetical protein n=1 Tax=Vitiosangium sp. (strain GDMCC 1.1324) TaxID=2138576 RepID=UPI001E43F54B|nr:hypothetical protein [Vitiosangium sp. GDMCC 1.1324]